jgi:hypothetical protein
MSPNPVQPAPSSLTSRSGVWGVVRGHWLLGLAYAAAFIVVGYCLPVVLNVMGPAQSGILPGTSSGLAESTVQDGFLRAFTTLLVIVGALLLILPVAWVYTFTKRTKYDPRCCNRSSSCRWLRPASSW